MTLTVRGCEFGASMRNFASTAVVMRADSLIMAGAPSDRSVRDARTDRELLARRILERLIRRQHDRGRSYPLVRGLDAGRRDALLNQRLGGAYQPVARHDDSVVGRHEVLLGPVDDRPHALLQRGVLHGEALHPAEGSARLLPGA